MRVCKVLSPVVATAKHAAFFGKKTLTVQPIDADGRPAGESFIAMDNVQAGEGDVVLVMNEGSGIRQILGETTSPCRALIVGIVDMVSEHKLPAPAAKNATTKAA
jgi:ethanolamine utilization protein EutN